MSITKDFIQVELNSLEQEAVKAKEHLLKLDGAITVYRLLLEKLDTPEPVEEPPSEP